MLPPTMGQQEQGGFRNAPFPFLGLQLVDAIHHEGDDIDADDEEQKDAIHGCQVRLSDEVHRIPWLVCRAAWGFLTLG